MDQPGNGEKYFYVSDSGNIEETTWKDRETDKGRLKIKNVHMTRGDATTFLKHMANFAKQRTQERQTVA